MNSIMLNWYVVQQALIKALDLHCYMVTTAVIIFLIKRTRGIESYQDVAENPLTTMILLAISFIFHVIMAYIVFK
jgi:hypothetical protein